ncbi:MAG TPA: helix-turn-helix transcriptional regulator [Gemmataceae bacterium]|jgi:transcriptional regulator with XRE-family HTH domain
MMNPEWFAGRLRELREAAGFTQQQLADKAGLTREGVAQLETERREPSWRTVVSLCQALGVSCEAFLKEPASGHKPGPGRPRKITKTMAEAEAPSTAPENMPPPQRKPKDRKARRPRGG